MLVSVEATAGLERRMKVQVPADRIESQVDERLRSYGKSAKLKGFRPGKVPFKVIQQRYGQQVRREVLNEVMQASFFEAISQERLNPAGGPHIEPETIEQGKDLTYTATFEVYPEIELKGLEGIEVERPVAEISEEDLDAMVENLRRQRAIWEPIERAAAEGDRVIIDFEGTVNGEPFEGNIAERLPVVLGQSLLVGDFEKKLEGIQAGEERRLEIEYPEEYPDSAVAGKSVDFVVQAQEVAAQRLPEADAEFCKSYGVVSGELDELRREVKANMQRELESVIQRRLKKQLLDGLVEANPVDLPKSLIDAEIQQLQVESARQLGINDPAQLPPPAAFEDQARRRVAISLLVNELIKEQDVTLDRQRVTAKVDDMVADYEDPVEAARTFHNNPELMQRIEMLVLEEQVVDWLLERAKITDGPSTFGELTNFGGRERNL